MTSSSWFAPADDPRSARRHGDLLALDPSVNSPGATLMRDGAIVACARVRIPADLAALDRGARYVRVAQEIACWWSEQVEAMDVAPRLRTLVYEHPQWYAASKSKGDPNKLAGLVGVGSALAAIVTCRAIMDGLRPPEVVAPLPAEWTKLPKATRGSYWKSPRGARLLERLEPGERAIVPDQHDAGDGAALALWAVGRMEPRRVFGGVNT